jgi:hypothetical protein
MNSAGRLAALHRLRAIVAASGDAEAEAVLHDLIGIGGEQSQQSARTIDARNLRDGHLRAAAGAFPNMPLIQLAAEFSRYVSDVWGPRDRLLDQMPPRYAGTLRAHFYNAMRAHPRAPGRRQLANIVGNDHALGLARDLDHDPDSEGENDEIHERSRRRANGSA